MFTDELYTHISKEYVNLLKVHRHGLIKNRPMAFHYDAHVSEMVCWYVQYVLMCIGNPTVLSEMGNSISTSRSPFFSLWKINKIPEIIILTGEKGITTQRVSPTDKMWKVLS